MPLETKKLIIMSNAFLKGETRLTLSGRGSCHIETSTLICSANQCTGFCMMETSAMMELKVENTSIPCHSKSVFIK